MNGRLSSDAMKRIGARLERLYGPVAPLCLERMAMLVGRYGVGRVAAAAAPERWSHRDAILIAYGDSLRAPGAAPLAALDRFARERLEGAFSTIHILPFFPYSSDDGFSVVHYRQVDPALGDWKDVEALRERFGLMFDLVLNHVSRKSGWFRDYELGVAPGRDYFIEGDPKTDLSAVVRPRSTPLLSPVHSRQGVKHVWTTFSADQVDLNFANPDVLFELLDILLFYVSKGARIIRLDAIAYLWKKPGTSCIHLPETHEIVKIMRDLLALVAPQAVLLTETNVPHAENVSYFGAGDEAHMVYQFSLPPLALHAALTGNAKHLTAWAAGLADPPPGCTFLNFTASHDGIGVRPLEGIVPDREIAALVDEVTERGGAVSSRRTADGGEKPYELNVTYFDAVSAPERHVERFLATQSVPLALKGVPAVYINSLLAAPNDRALAKETGRARSINRTKWDLPAVEATLGDSSSAAARVMDRILHMLRVRAGCGAFHPDGAQRVLELDPRVFAVERVAPGGDARVLALTNFSGDEVPVRMDAAGTDLLSGRKAARDLKLPPYGVTWVSV